MGQSKVEKKLKKNEKKLRKRLRKVKEEKNNNVEKNLKIRD